jgi:hypothetical protein
VTAREESRLRTTSELWDTASSNLVGAYPTERAALAIVIVRNAMKEHEPERSRRSGGTQSIPRKRPRIRVRKRGKHTVAS